MKLQSVRSCLGKVSILISVALILDVSLVAAAVAPPSAPGNPRLVVASSSPVGQDFAARCASPGVLVCEGFDSQAAIDWDASYPFGKGFFWNGVSPASGQGTLDTAVKSSGEGSLRFNVPDSRVPEGAGNAGQFRQPFGAEFGEGATFYLQWRMRFSPEMLAFTADNTAGGVGYKQIIAHRNGTTYAATELTFTNDYFNGFPTWYTAGGMRKVENSLPPYEYQRQQGDYGTCIYPDHLTAADCWYYSADEWLTFYWKVQIGTWGQPDSHLEAWAARGSGVFEKIFDKSDMVLTSSGDYNYVTLLPYMNGRADNGTPTHPQAYVWYDDLIVSTQPIPAPGAIEDPVGPGISITTPRSAEVVSGQIVVAATVVDNYGTAGVQFELNGSNIGREDTTPPYSIVFDSMEIPNGTNTLLAIARGNDNSQMLSVPVDIIVDNSIGTTPRDGSLVLVDFSGQEGMDSFEIAGWDTVIKDTYTKNTSVGRGGTTITVGSNLAYNYQGVTGSPLSFAEGDRVVVTWYNNSSEQVVFTPRISFQDPDRPGSGTGGTWYNMSNEQDPADRGIVIGPYGEARSVFDFDSTTQGVYSLVNANVNFSNNNVIVCDKIEVSGGLEVTQPVLQPPTNLAAGSLATDEISISWSESISADVVGYRVYRNGNRVGTTDVTSFLDTGLAEGTTYTYTVTSYNGLTNESAYSVSVSAATAGVRAPVPPVISTNISPMSGASPLMVTFDASGSTDADGTIVSYSWIIGENVFDGANIVHEFVNDRTDALVVSVVLTVTDSDGLSDNRSFSITVNPEGDLANLPEVIFEDGIENWVVDRFAGNSLAGGQLYQGPAREVGGLQRPWSVVEAGNGDVYLTVGIPGAASPTLLKVTADGVLRLAMAPDGLIEGPMEECQAGDPIWNSGNNTLYLTGPNCLRRVVTHADGSLWVELVAGRPGVPGSQDGAALTATLKPRYGSVCTSSGACYWLEDSALRKIEDGVVSTVSLTRPESPGYLWNLYPGIQLLSEGEDANTLYISDYYGSKGYSIVRCDLTTGVLTRVVGITKGEDIYNRQGQETDGPALTHVGFNSGARGRYDAFHNALWVMGPDHVRFRWLPLDGDGWVRTVFGALRPGTVSQRLGVNELNSLEFPGEQFRPYLDSVCGLDSKGGVFLIGVMDRSGVWRAYNKSEVQP